MRRTIPLFGVIALVLVTWAPTGSASAPGLHAVSRPACTITGTDGDDDLYGTTGPDVICALGGDDEVQGLAGNDVIFLGGGNDYANLGRGDDVVYGGAGLDYVGPSQGNDRIFLQRGRDTIEDYYGVDLLSGGAATDYLSALDGRPHDRLVGGPGSDAYCADAGDVLRSVEDTGSYCED